MADNAAIDAALTARLIQDDTLYALLGDGVFWDVAPESAERFVLLSQLVHADEGEFDDTAYEVLTYLVKAVIKGTSSADSDTAAARIKVLLDQGETGFPGVLAPTGFTVLLQQRTGRIRIAEVDQTSEETWQHAGGQYEIWAQPTS